MIEVFYATTNYGDGSYGVSFFRSESDFEKARDYHPDAFQDSDLESFEVPDTGTIRFYD